MNDLFLSVAANLVGFGVALPVGFCWGARWAKRRDASTPQGKEHPRMRRPEFRSTRFIVLLIVAFLALTGIGIQGVANQRQNAEVLRQNARVVERLDEADQIREEQVRCIQAWGNDIVATIKTRVSATGELTRAESARSRAIDRVLLIVIALRKIPPQATDEDFQRTLDLYADALRDLQNVRRETSETKRENPYAKLYLDCEE